MPFLQIQRDGNKAKITLDTKARMDGVQADHISLTWECSTELFAALLVERLRDNLRETIAAIRKDAYEEGWRTAKAKGKRGPKRKEDQHWGGLP